MLCGFLDTERKGAPKKAERKCSTSRVEAIVTCPNLSEEQGQSENYANSISQNSSQHVHPALATIYDPDSATAFFNFAEADAELVHGAELESYARR